MPELSLPLVFTPKFEKKGATMPMIGVNVNRQNPLTRLMMHFPGLMSYALYPKSCVIGSERNRFREELASVEARSTRGKLAGTLLCLSRCYEQHFDFYFSHSTIRA